MPRTTRRSLKTLQNTATDIENLVGRPSKSLKHQLSQEPVVDVEVKRKTLSTKEVPPKVNVENKISAKDLTDPKGASENYWQILSEKRQVALHEALDENEKLRKIIEDLKQENIQYKQMLDETNAFVEVIKEELANGSNNDTGIDVNDVSADETQEDDNKSKTND